MKRLADWAEMLIAHLKLTTQDRYGKWHKQQMILLLPPRHMKSEVGIYVEVSEILFL